MTTEQPSPSPPLNPTLEEIISKRHSSRLFLSTPVPKSSIQTALELAQLAPSNSNIQPWHFVIVSGNRLEKLKAALYAAASVSTPNIPPLPEGFSHFRSALGKMVYGVGMGIARDDCTFIAHEFLIILFRGPVRYLESFQRYTDFTS